MSKYGSCITFGRAFNYEKEEMKHALNGEILTDWDEEGNPQWEKGTKEETDKVVLEAFDNLFFQADQMRMQGCAMEKLLGKMTRRQIQKYMQYMEEECMKPSDYEYEQYEDEAPDRC